VLEPHPEAVVDEAFSASEFLDPRDLVQVKYEMVRRVRVEGDTVVSSAASSGSPGRRSTKRRRHWTEVACPPLSRPAPGPAGLTS